MTDAPNRTLLWMLPGLDGTGRLLEPIAARLGDAFDVEVVAYPQTPIGYAQLAHILAPRLPRDRAFAIVGESFAGPLALMLAALRPPGLRAVVLSASFARYPHAMLRGLAPVVRALPARAAPMELMTRFLLGRFDAPRCRDWLLGAIRGVPPDVLKARVLAALGVDATHALRTIDVPLLCLRASDDRVVGNGAARAIAEAKPGATIVDVDGPHFLLQVATDACAAAIATFLDATADDDAVRAARARRA
ncbi:MAG TPA: alpha/beta hydrolase [Xanthomonadales bacterium]|nr:alpha/beta hydrolase [Xanthomonadales bacterium]